MNATERVKPRWRNGSPEQVKRCEALLEWMKGYYITVADVARQLGWTYTSAHTRLFHKCLPKYKAMLLDLGFPEELLAPDAIGQGGLRARAPFFPGLHKKKPEEEKQDSSANQA